MAKAFGQMIQKMIAEAVAADLTKKLFGESGGGGVAGGLLTGFGKLLGFANGGIMSSSGSMPLKRYATGGIANTPQFAMFGEGSMNEAYVPLPDGRSIPVKMKGGNKSGNVVNVYVNGTTAHDVKRAGGEVGRSVVRALGGAQRYA